MNPDKMRQCMSLAYSAKSKLANTIGQCKFSTVICLVSIYCRFLLPLKLNFDCAHLFCYFKDGNGFKTSTMRLGADVIVFSRYRGKDGKRFVILLLWIYLVWCFFFVSWILLLSVEQRCICQAMEVVDSLCYNPCSSQIK